MVRPKNPQKYDFDDIDPWRKLLASVSCAIIHNIDHTTLQVTPGQLVFGRGMLLNLKFLADWEALRLRNKKNIDKNNSKENSLRTHHDY